MKELEEGTALTLDFNKLTKAVAACPGVIPVAVQHVDTREIILIAYVNEIALRKAIEAQTEILRNTDGEEARRREMAKLADLQLRLDMEQEARRRFYGS